jgi:ubiquinone/menaquinone biosynthesis C-methylase UbiE
MDTALISAMNYFAPQTAAERYAKGRPDVHTYSIDQIGSFLQLGNKLDRVLDIACGTGLSTKALLSIGQNVYGTDISLEMLHYAPCKDIIHYALSPAEKQPFNDHFFDLITVSSGVHWFDIDKFLPEACRLLKSRSHLVLYENYFDSAIEGAENFKAWCIAVHYQRFPSPPRNKYEWTEEKVRPAGLTYITEWRSSYSIPMTKQQLACYLTTQSNVIAQVEAGKTSYRKVESWLNRELDPFFASAELPRQVRFGNWIKFLQRAE